MAHINAGIAVLKPKSKRRFPKVNNRFIPQTKPKMVRFFLYIALSRPCASPIKNVGILAELNKDKPAKATKLRLKTCPLTIWAKEEKDASERLKLTIPIHKVAPNRACQTANKENNKAKTPMIANIKPMISGVASKEAD